VSLDPGLFTICVVAIDCLSQWPYYCVMNNRIQHGTSVFAATMLLFCAVSLLSIVDAKAHDPAQSMCSDVHAAAYLDEPGEMKALIEQGANLNCLDSLNQTPLITATDGASLDIVVMLLAQGVDLNRRDEIGETALIKAQRKESSFQGQGGQTYRDIFARISSMLLKAGAIEYAEIKNSKPAGAPSKP